MTYKETLIDAMRWLAEQSDTIFVGQTVTYGGSYMGTTFAKVPESKKVEFGVMEETQMGISLGLALEGYCVISLYPRFDFLLLAMSQLVNHIDKIGWMSDGKMRPRIIIRTSVGPKKPLDAGPQHTGRYTNAFKEMLTTVNVVELASAEMVAPYYRRAYEDQDLRLWLFVEDGSQY